MRSLFLCLVSAAIAPLSAQIPAVISPLDAQTQLGNSNNNYPLSWGTGAYQQVHSAASFSNNTPATINRLRMRMGQGYSGSSGYPIDVELFMGDSPHGADAVSGTFANNIVGGTEVNVVTRKNINLPTVPNNDWAVAPFPFDVPFVWNGGDLEWRAIVHGNGNNNQRFSYPVDAFWSLGESTRIGSTLGCQSALGTQAASHSVSLYEPGNTATFYGYSYVAAGGLPTVLTFGGSDSSWSGLPLPFDLGVIGAPMCFITNDILLTRGNATQAGSRGQVVDMLTIPDDPTLAGASFFSQYLFLQTGANQLGLFTSDGRRNTIGKPIGVARVFAQGNTGATGGVVGPEFGIAIGLN